jgi:Glycosyl hydrolases family 16
MPLDPSRPVTASARASVPLNDQQPPPADDGGLAGAPAADKPDVLARKHRRGNLLTIFAVVLFVVGAAYVVFAPKHGDTGGGAGVAEKTTPTPAPESASASASASPSRIPRPSSTIPGSSGVAMPKGDIAGWHQTFADDFMEGEIDDGWWNYQPSQPGGDPGGWFDPSHVSTVNGDLVISGSRADTPNGNLYVTGGINNSKSFQQTYGLFKVRFRADVGRGIAYTMMLWPVDDVWPPEIDILEDNGKDRKMTSATLHYGANDTKVHKEVTGDFSVWHTAELEWTPGKLVYRLDGKVWTTMTSSNVPNIPMSIAIQTQAWKCGGSWEGCPTSSTPAKVNFYVDWVVAYSKA